MTFGFGKQMSFEDEQREIAKEAKVHDLVAEHLNKVEATGRTVTPQDIADAVNAAMSVVEPKPDGLTYELDEEHA